MGERMKDLIRLYRVWKIRALMWIMRRLMVRAERLSRPEVT
jgi:hypothetical protein